MNSRLTLDYGMRFTHQQPQYDQFGQMSNFFPDQWSAGAAPVFYIAGCSNGAVTCSGNTRNAMDPLTGQILTCPGAANTQAAIGTPIPDTGNPINGIIKAGEGIANTGYTWPAVVFGPRAGSAYDLGGNQYLVSPRRRRPLLRPSGRQHRVLDSGLPADGDRARRPQRQLGDARRRTQPGPVPALVTFQYDAKVPSSVQWNARRAEDAPWSSSIDVSYVGSHGYNRLGGFQGGNDREPERRRFRHGVPGEHQDPTKGTNAIPGAAALRTNLLRPYRGLRHHPARTRPSSGMSPHDPDVVQPPIPARVPVRHQPHAGSRSPATLACRSGCSTTADGTFSVRADQAQYEALNQTLNLQRHVLKANAIWDLPHMSTDGGTAHKVLAYAANGWQVSGIWTGTSGNRYDLGFGYQGGIGNVNLTGSPDYGARIIYKDTGIEGTGCSNDQYRQFNAVGTVAGPGFNSVGLESGRNIMQGCFVNVIDSRLSRSIQLSGGKTFSIQFDMFNAFNIVNINARNSTVSLNSPTDQTVRNSQILA